MDQQQFETFARANAKVPIAWPDDALTFNAEQFSEVDVRTLPPAKQAKFISALEAAVTEVQDRAGRGDPPQLRMRLAPGDSIADYLGALGDREALYQMRYRAAGHCWTSGGATDAGGPQGPYSRCQVRPQEAYLAAMARETYDT